MIVDKELDKWCSGGALLGDKNCPERSQQREEEDRGQNQ